MGPSTVLEAQSPGRLTTFRSFEPLRDVSWSIPLSRRPPASLCIWALLAVPTACGLSTQGTSATSGQSSSGGLVQGDDGASSGSTGGSSSGYGSSGSTSGSSSGFSVGDDSGLGDDGGPVDPPDAPQSNGPCNYAGTWASKLTIDVTWAPQGLNSIILAPGMGQIKQWIRGSRTQQGSTVTDATVVCGIDLPDFQSSMLAASETYGVVFPASLFDSKFLPTFTVNGTVSGPMAGATYATTSSAALLGLSLSNPTSDVWPSTVSTEVDMDKDMEPGVTIGVASGATSAGGAYSGVPVGIPAPFAPTVRANKLYVAIRQLTVVSATVKDCDHINGVVTIPSVGGKSGIDSHVLGCELAAGGDCTSTQATFVDNTQPVFTPTGTGTISSARVPSGVTCAAVRQMLP
jgi:hypothetical protein